MPRYLLCCLAWLSPCLALAAMPVEQELSYSLGVRLGERLRADMPELQLEALLKGLRQGYNGTPLELSRQRIDQLLAAHAEALAKAEREHSAELVAQTRFLVQEKARAGVRELAGGVLVSELRAGSGKPASARREVLVNYQGWLADGSRFDASDKPQWFRLDSVIAGWRIALREMPQGARWRVVIPAQQAYGAEGAGDLIPPFAPLVFELELLDSR